jgi:hypothetical protein
MNGITLKFTQYFPLICQIEIFKLNMAVQKLHMFSLKDSNTSVQGRRKAGTMREIHTGAKKKKGAEGA